jgi:hypothetical protein
MATDVRIPSVQVPPLRNGDRMDREECERRWDAMPDLKKAELIEGVVYMPPALSRKHGTPHFDIIGWLYMYRAITPGLEGADNASVRFDKKNMPQPDALLRIEEKYAVKAASMLTSTMRTAPN